MTQRFALHSILCIFFAGFGCWLYLQLDNSESDFINAVFLASYWFGLLIFIFVSWFFYWLLHRRSTQSWFIAQFIAVLTALIATALILIISHQHEQRRITDEQTYLHNQGSLPLPIQDENR